MKPIPTRRNRLDAALWSVLAVAACLGAADAVRLLLPGSAAPPHLREYVATWAPELVYYVGGCAAALVLGALQLLAPLRRAAPAAHQAIGGAYLIAVTMAGMAALILAAAAMGGAAARLGFAAQALGWLTASGLGLRTLLRGDAEAHERWMVRSYALALAAVTLRFELVLAVDVLHAGLAPAYAALAWLCWLPNLLLAEWWLRRRGK